MTRPFYDYCAEHFPSPADTLEHYFAEIREAAAEVGALLDHVPKVDEGWVYLPSLTGKLEQKHSYKAEFKSHPDGTVWPHLVFYSQKTQQNVQWNPRDLAFQEFQRGGRKSAGISPAQREARVKRDAELQARSAAIQANQEADRQKGQLAAAQAARTAWEDASPCTEHPYLSAKGVPSYGLRVATRKHRAQLRNSQGKWVLAKVTDPGDLLVPMYDADGALWNFEYIFPAKGEPGKFSKKGLMGGRVTEVFFRIPGKGPAWLVEGYATGASIRESTGESVVVAFAANRLRGVAQQLDGQIRAVAADNDASEKGYQAGASTGLVVIMPPDTDTDFNDYHQTHGSKALAKLMVRLLHASKCVYIPFLDLTDKGAPRNTIENYKALMQTHGIRARYNRISKDVELDIPGLVSTRDNHANTAITELTSRAARNALSVSQLKEYVKAIADEDAYCPISEWVQSAPWDGVDRLAEFVSTVETDNPDLRDILLKRWMISAVAAVMKPFGFWSKGVLTFAGPQNLGKTSWFRSLVPDSLRHLIREGMHLDAQDRDHVIRAVSNWLVELGELESTLRRDIESLKAFITQTTDRLRRPYDRVDCEYGRRTVFFASVNSERFLKDSTGNSRFWVLRCTRIHYDHKLDMQQVWAQVYEQYYLKGEQWHLTPDEQDILDQSNGDFREVSPIEELIPNRFDLSLPPKQFITATEVLIKLDYQRPSRPQLLEATQALKALGVTSKRKGGRTLWGLPFEKFGA